MMKATIKEQCILPLHMIHLKVNVLDLEKANTAQAKEIASLKKRVNQLEKRKKSRTSRLKRLRKVGSASRVESSNDVKILLLWKRKVSAVDQLLLLIKAAKLKAITTAVTTTTTIRPKAGGVVVQEPNNEVAIDAIPLATKPPMIVEYKIDKEGKMGYFKLIRADGSSKRYSSMIQMLQGIDREDLETLWKFVKEKHGLRRPKEDYERVLWGDLKVMFEPDVESELQLLSDYYCWKDYADRDEIKDLSEKR
ncbi:hypothetical protein Tco_1071335 [Tanacetum coccineum]